MTRSIFEAELVSAFDRGRALCVAGNPVDIRIAKRWCSVEGIDIESLQQSLRWSVATRVFKLNGCVCAIASALLLFDLFWRDDARSTDKMSWYTAFMLAVLPAVGILLLWVGLFVKRGRGSWEFENYLDLLRKQMDLSPVAELDQDGVQYAGELELEASAQALDSAESRLNIQIQRICSLQERVNRSQIKSLTDACEKESNRFNFLYRIYSRAYKVDEQGAYMARVQSENGTTKK